MDIVFIEDLRVDTVIGIFDWEREIRQTVSIDLEMAFNIRKAAATDDIAHTLDYKAVGKRIISFVEAASYQLVETLAEEIAGIVLREFEVSEVKLKLNKRGALRGSSGVGVRITRRAEAA